MPKCEKCGWETNSDKMMFIHECETKQAPKKSGAK